MKKRVSIFAVLGLVLSVVTARAATITVQDLKDWNASTNSQNRTYTAFQETNLPTWTHTLTFAPPAASFDSVSIELSHSGNRGNGNEMWLLWDSGSVQLGELDSSSNSANASYTIQIFNVPSTLLPSLPASNWSLVLRLSETGDDTDNEVYLDYSLLTAVYQSSVREVEAIDDVHMPEPASFVLLGTGLMAVAARRFRSRRA
jgi:hypothetical protein